MHGNRILGLFGGLESFTIFGDDIYWVQNKNEVKTKVILKSPSR